MTANRLAAGRSVLLTALAGVCLLGAFQVRLSAAPTGEEVVRGQADFTRDGNLTLIEASHNSIIEYTGFDILAPETVQFIQPGAESRVLNRVNSSDPTRIDGSLLANGIIYLVNPAGVMFGEGSVIDVAGIYAAAAHLGNQDFLNGVDSFVNAQGEVINRGTVLGEMVSLIGKHVANYGSIICDGGLFAMSAGDNVYLSRVGDHFMVQIQGGDAADQAGVLNAGTISAPGGSVQLGAGDLYSLAVHHAGTTQADRIVLEGQGDGIVDVGGTLDASSADAVGGTVHLLGDKVGLFDAEVDAAGATGGGTVLVGGDLRGEGEIPTASRTYVSEGSTIRADATQSGDGGKVIVWSDEWTRFHGDISARGGAEGGDGGFAEISSALSLQSDGAIDVGADAGSAGTILYDPRDIQITGSSGNSPGFDGSDANDLGKSNLKNDTDPLGEIDFDAVGDADPFIVYESEIEGTNANIILEAKNSITVADGAGFDGSDVALTGTNSLVLRTRNDEGDNAGSALNPGIDLTAGGTLTGLEFTTVDGSIRIESGRIRAAGGPLDPGDVAGGDADIAAPVTVGKLTTTGTGSIYIVAEGDVTVSNTVQTTGGGDISIKTGTGAVTLRGDLDPSGTLTAPGVTAVTVGGSGSIQDGIEIVQAAGAVSVGGGTYSEDLAVDKALTLESSVPLAAILNGHHIVTAGGVMIDGFALAAASNVVIQIDSSGSAISGVTIQNNEFNLASGDVGVWLGGNSATNQPISTVIITGNTFNGPGDRISKPMRIGGWFGGGDLDVEIQGLTFSYNTVTAGSIPVQWRDENISDLHLTYNDFTNTDGALYLWTELALGNHGDLEGFQFTNNKVDNTSSGSYGVGIDINNRHAAEDFVDPALLVRGNKFLGLGDPGYGFGAFAVSAGGSIDASGNYWSATSSADDPLTEAAMQLLFASSLGSVDYTPWLNLSTGDQSPGFMGDFSDLTVSDSSPQTGVLDAIAEGIDDVAAAGGGTVSAVAGTYADVNVDESDVTLHFLGPGASQINTTDTTALTTVAGSTVSGDDDLTINGHAELAGDIDPVAGVLSFLSTVDINGDVTLGAEDIDFGGAVGPDPADNSLTLTLQPTTNSANINIGDAGAAADLNLTYNGVDGDLDQLADGFDLIRIGRWNGAAATGTGTMTTASTVPGYIQFQDSVALNMGGAGGEILVNSELRGMGDGADDGDVTINGPGSTTTLNADIVTAGSAITINDDVLLGPTTVTLDTTSGAPNGANVTVTGAIDDVAAASALTIKGGNLGDVDLQGTVGDSAAIAALDVSAENISLVDIGGAAAGVTGTTVLNAATDVTFNGTNYNANQQTYEADAEFNVDSGNTTTFATNGSSIDFNAGNIDLADGSDLVVGTGAGAGSILIEGMIDGGAGVEEFVSLDAGADSVSVGDAVGSTTPVSYLTATGDSVSVVAVTADGANGGNGNGIVLAETGAGPVTIGGALSATGGNIAISTDGALALSQDLTASGDVQIGVNGTFTNADIAASPTTVTHTAGNIRTTNAAGDVIIIATAAYNQSGTGSIGTAADPTQGDVFIDPATVNIGGSGAYVDGAFQVEADNSITVAANVTAGDEIAMRANSDGGVVGDLTHTNGTITSDDHDGDNDGGVLLAGVNVILDLGGDGQAAGGVSATGDGTWAGLTTPGSEFGIAVLAENNVLVNEQLTTVDAGDSSAIIIQSDADLTDLSTWPALLQGSPAIGPDGVGAVTFNDSTAGVQGAGLQADGDIQLDANGGDIQVREGLLKASLKASGTVQMFASGDIVDAGDATVSEVEADTLSITGADSVGTDAGNGALDMDVTTLLMSDVGGNAFFLEADDVSLGAVSTSANDGNITLTSVAAGDIQVTGAVTAHGNGDITLTNDNGSILDNGGSLNADVVALTATNGNVGADTARIETAANTLDVRVLSASRDIFINEAGAVVIARAQADDPTGEANVRAGGTITVVTGSVVGGTATLTSTGGNIQGQVDDGTAEVTGGTVNLTAASGAIGPTAPVDVSATTALNATTGGGKIEIDSIGNLPLDLVDAGAGAVALDSTGNINDANAGLNNVSATTLAMVALGGIGSGNALETAVTNLDALNTVAGNIEIDNTGDLNLVDLALDVNTDSVTNTGGDVLIRALSDLNINEPVSAAGDYFNTATGHLSVNANVTATNGNVGLRADSDNDSGGNLVHDEGAISATAGGVLLAGENVTLDSSGDAVLAGGVSATGTFGAQTPPDTDFGIAVFAEHDLVVNENLTASGADGHILLSADADLRDAGSWPGPLGGAGATPDGTGTVSFQDAGANIQGANVSSTTGGVWVAGMSVSTPVPGTMISAGGELARTAGGNVTAGVGVVTAGDMDLSGATVTTANGGRICLDPSFDFSAQAATSRAYGWPASGAVGPDTITLGGALGGADAGEVRFKGDVMLVGPTTVATAGGTGDDIVFEGTIDGPQSLSLDANDGGAGLIEFRDDIGVDQTLDVLNLNEPGRADTPLVATIIGVRRASEDGPPLAMADGELRIEVDTFSMGQNEKFSILGSLVLLGETITLADVSTLGDLFVGFDGVTNWPVKSLTLRSRSGAGVTVVTAASPNKATEVQTDQGLDLVAGANVGADPRGIRIVVSAAAGDPGLTGSAILSDPFASAETYSGPSAGALSIVKFPEDAAPMIVDLMTSVDGQTVLDLREVGTVVTNLGSALAGALPLPAEFEQAILGAQISAATAERLRDLGIYPRDLTPEELIEAIVGRGIYEDVPDLIGGEQFEVAKVRLPFAATTRAVETFDRTFNGRSAKTVTEMLQGSLDRFLAVADDDEFDPSAFRAFLEAETEEADSLAFINGMRSLLQQLGELGLAPVEFGSAKTALLRAIRPQGLTIPQLEKLIMGPARAQ